MVVKGAPPTGTAGTPRTETPGAASKKLVDLKARREEGATSFESLISGAQGFIGHADETTNFMSVPSGDVLGDALQAGATVRGVFDASNGMPPDPTSLSGATVKLDQLRMVSELTKSHMEKADRALSDVSVQRQALENKYA
jgi:hypothetical protein